MQEPEIITLEHVSKVYEPGIYALNDVSLHIRRGEFVFVIGDSGAGKSTLIKLFLRELVPTSGSINVLGYDLTKIREAEIPAFRRNIGMVFQNFRLLEDRNVYDNVAFAQSILEVPEKEIRKNVPTILASVGLAGKYKSEIGQLSGGEKQRVAIARALVNKPQVLLADEPTGNLDPDTALDIMRLFEKINDTGATVVVITHNLEIVKAMDKRVITLRDGKLE